MQARSRCQPHGVRLLSWLSTCLTRLTHYLSFIQYWIPEGKDIPLAEKRKLHVTKEMFSALCERFKIPAYYVETLLRPNQLGRLGAATGLFPGPDHRPEIWGMCDFRAFGMYKVR